MSWKPEVFVEGKWSRNALVFATKEEAEASAFNLFSRWMLTEDHRAVEVDEPVNYRWHDGRLVHIAEAAGEGEV
jgi:hypothetical protein